MDNKELIKMNQFKDLAASVFTNVESSGGLALADDLDQMKNMVAYASDYLQGLNDGQDFYYEDHIWEIRKEASKKFLEMRAEEESREDLVEYLEIRLEDLINDVTKLQTRGNDYYDRWQKANREGRGGEVEGLLQEYRNTLNDVEKVKNERDKIEDELKELRR